MTKILTAKEIEQQVGEAPGATIAPLLFTQVKDFTTFTAEYTALDEDIVFHFFLPEDLVEGHAGRALSEEDRITWGIHLLHAFPALDRYWTDLFPGALERTSYRIFHTGPPRITAAYTEEVASWWLRIRGIHFLETITAMTDFLRALDHDLDEAGAQTLLTCTST